MSYHRLKLTKHAVERMVQRRITRRQIAEAIESGVTVEDYPDDDPLPSRLILGWSGSVPLHIVIADDDDLEVTIVVTVYHPDSDVWEEDLMRRRR